MFRLTILSLFVVSFLSLGFGGGIVNAQSDYDWCYTFDWTDSNNYQYISVTNPDYFPPYTVDGLQSVLLVSGSYHLRLLYFKLDFPVASHVRFVSHRTSSTATNFSAPHYDTGQTTALRYLDTEIESTRYSLNNTAINTIRYPFDYDVGNGRLTDEIWFSSNPRLQNVHWYNHETEIRGDGTEPYPALENECDTGDELVQPIKQSDRQTHDNLQDTNASPVNGLVTGSGNQDAIVHAVTDGVVTSIEPVTQSLCPNYLFLSHEAVETDCNILTRNIIYSLDYQNTSIIKILASSGIEYAQLVDHADNYVIEGQTVTAGCWLGKVPTANSLFGASQSLTVTWSIESDEFTETIPDELLSADEPPESSPCFQPDGFTQCLGDHSGEDASRWTVTGTTLLDGNTFTLFQNASVSGYFNLDADREPELIIGHFDERQSQVSLQLGTTSIQTIFTDGQARIEADTHQPDNGEIYTVSVKNLHSLAIRFNYICVRHTLDANGDPIDADTNYDDIATGDPPAPDNDPPAVQQCVFVNNSFDDGTVSWTVSGGVEGATGAINIDDLGTIEQNVTTATDRTLTVILGYWAYNTYTPDPTDTTATIQLEYNTGSGYTSIGTKTMADLASHNNRVVMETTVTAFNGTFTLRPTLSSTPSEVRGVTIYAICLNASGSNPVYNPEADSGIFEAQCGLQIPTASGDNLFTWIPWLWSHLNKFFQCDLMILLNEMYRIAVEFFTLFGWVSRYSMVLADTTIDWFGQQFVPWLDGHLSNIAVAAGGFDEVSPECDLFFCTLYEGFDLLGALIEFLKSLFGIVIEVLEGLWEFGLQILNAIFNIFNSFRAFFDAVISAYLQAEPADFPFLPTCSINRKSSGFCILLWILENTVLSGSGALFIPLLISYGGIMWLLWAIIEIKKVVNQAARAF